ncbi:MAG: periplasmic heavy metal sensor [Paracoccaceae bacterium]
MQKYTYTTPRWIKITLGISLALNIAIIGIFTGISLHGTGGRHTNTVQGVALLARAMPYKFEHQLRTTLRARRDQMHTDRKAMLLSKAHMIAALAAEPFDISAVEAVLDSQRGATNNVISAGHQAIMRQITQMSLQDRQRYIENLQNAPYRGRLNFRASPAAENQP